MAFRNHNRVIYTVGSGIYQTNSRNYCIQEIICIGLTGTIIIHAVGGGSFVWNATPEFNRVKVVSDGFVVQEGEFVAIGEQGSILNNITETYTFWIDELNNFFVDEHGCYYILN